MKPALDWITRFGMLVVPLAMFGCGGDAETTAPQVPELAIPAPAAEPGEVPDLFPDDLQDPESAENSEPVGKSQSGANDGRTATPASAANADEVQPGTPEWLIQEIIALRLKPLPAQRTGDEGGADVDVNALREQRRGRNLKVIELATEALALANKDPDREEAFETAAHHLLDARLQLALQGDREQIDALYETAGALYQRDPDSEAAAEAALTLVNLAHLNTQRFADQEPRWVQEFARQAQLYGSTFPSHSEQSLPLLLAAGRSCEFHGFLEEAKSCYALVQHEFPESDEAQHVVGILRRLQLPGKPLQLAGPTIDGNFVAIDDYRGRVVVVVFWASNARALLEQLPPITALETKHGGDVAVLGVNLDTEEPEVEQFLERNPLTWAQIFYSDRQQRGWNSPLATYYGINNLPTIWLVDRDGIVIDVAVDASQLEEQVDGLIKPAN